MTDKSNIIELGKREVYKHDQLNQQEKDAMIALDLASILARTAYNILDQRGHVQQCPDWCKDNSQIVALAVAVRELSEKAFV